MGKITEKRQKLPSSAEEGKADAVAAAGVVLVKKIILLISTTPSARLRWLRNFFFCRAATPPQLRRGIISALALLLAFAASDRCFPVPTAGRDSPYALVVLARDGTPLRAFPGSDHVWRHPVSLDEVSPLYLDALIKYEDRTFRWHPGVNPFALLRAGWQWLRYGRVISGGSTITMQVARMIQPTRRTITGKLIQIARALQIERHYSKNEILTLYMNYAPMGGVLEGVEAASRAYLGKSSNRLTHAEAALLTVLPQLPSRLRPDRYPQRAQLARDKVLRRM